MNFVGLFLVVFSGGEGRDRLMTVVFGTETLAKTNRQGPADRLKTTCALEL